MRKLYISVLLVGAIVGVFSLSASANDKKPSNLEIMGYTESEISAMSEYKKIALNRLYNSDNTIKILPDSGNEMGLLGVNDITVEILGGNTAAFCPSGYKCRAIYMVSDINLASWEVDKIKEVAAGVAWADGWNTVSYEAEVDYGDFWGNPVNADMSLYDATPEVGLSWRYDSIPSHVNDIASTVSVLLRRPNGDTGSTDIVGKFGYTEKNIDISVYVSVPPSVQFTPASDVYQKADTGLFTY